jgi:uncharacterized protein YtpQ (UPF0354 family)
MTTNTPTNVTLCNVNPQLLTSFPNQNEKLIDYVLVYDKLDESHHTKSQSKLIARRAFFDKLKEEKFSIYEIEHKCENKTKIYALLNCSTERLLEEAELIRLEMILKNVRIFIVFQFCQLPIMSKDIVNSQAGIYRI